MHLAIDQLSTIVSLAGQAQVMGYGDLSDMKLIWCMLLGTKMLLKCDAYASEWLTKYEGYGLIVSTIIRTQTFHPFYPPPQVVTITVSPEERLLMGKGFGVTTISEMRKLLMWQVGLLGGRIPNFTVVDMEPLSRAWSKYIYLTPKLAESSFEVNTTRESLPALLYQRAKSRSHTSSISNFKNRRVRS